ncbi:MAG: hypothetical protein ACYS47_10685 [Planctomycetota bacterium]
MGIFSSLGVAFLLEPGWLLAFVAGLLFLSLALMAREAWRRGHVLPLLLGVLSSASILVGKFALESDAVMYASMACLVAASIWNVLPTKKRKEVPHVCEQEAV